MLLYVVCNPILGLRILFDTPLTFYLMNSTIYLIYSDNLFYFKFASSILKKRQLLLVKELTVSRVRFVLFSKSISHKNQIKKGQSLVFSWDWEMWEIGQIGCGRVSVQNRNLSQNVFENKHVQLASFNPSQVSLLVNQPKIMIINSRIICISVLPPSQKTTKIRETPQYTNPTRDETEIVIKWSSLIEN